jgi:hypothetical protein
MWDKIVYTSGPYRAATPNGVARNIQEADRYAALLWAMGAAVICPHKNTAFLDGVISVDPEEDGNGWITGDITMVRRCDAIFMLPRWQKSRGALQELKAAYEEKILIFSHHSLVVLKEWLETGRISDVHTGGIIDSPDGRFSRDLKAAMSGLSAGDVVRQ